MTIELRITGMSCQHCERAVREALSAVPGVSAAAVELGAGTARVEGSAPAADLLHAVREAGYQAECIVA